MSKIAISIILLSILPPRLGPIMRPMEYEENSNENPRAMFVSSHISATMTRVITANPIYK